MEEKINIAEILNDKQKGIRLYSPIFGECAFSFVQEETDNICVKQRNGEKAFFNSKGLYNILGECLLFPSKEMRDWRKFAWKKGDVLVSNDGGTEVIFDKWYDDTYTNFYCKHYLNSEDENNIKYNEAFLCTTERYSIEDKDAAQTYINTIEERLGGKLNRDTLEVEKTQPEFKDGDIAFADYGNRQDVFIVSDKTDLSEGYSSFISLDLNSLTLSIGCRTTFFKKDLCKLRLATKEEKLQLFDALAKEGKVWDSAKKQIVDLKPKWITPKPFDRVITRGDNNDIWTANIFSHMNSYGEYVAIGCVGGYHYCLPYNDETAHLIGTTDDWKGGEG